MKKLVIILIIAVGLFVGADFAAAAATEYQVSKQMAARLHLTSDPDVRINGFPFLYQAAVGDFRDVQINADGVPVGPLNNVGLQADLRNARFSPTQVIAGNPATIQVDEIDGQVRIQAPDVARLIPDVQNLTLKPAAKDALSGVDSSGADQTTPGTTVDPTKAAVELDGRVNIAGMDNNVQVIAVVELIDGQIKIEPRKLQFNNSFGQIPLPPAFEQSLDQQFTTTIDPGELPFKVTPTAVQVEQDGTLVVAGTAHNVTLSGDGSSP